MTSVKLTPYLVFIKKRKQKKQKYTQLKCLQYSLNCKHTKRVTERAKQEKRLKKINTIWLREINIKKHISYTYIIVKIWLYQNFFC